MPMYQPVMSESEPPVSAHACGAKPAASSAAMGRSFRKYRPPLTGAGGVGYMKTRSFAYLRKVLRGVLKKTRLSAERGRECSEVRRFTQVFHTRVDGNDGYQMLAGASRRQPDVFA